jgi:hypothetical protein
MQTIPATSSVGVELQLIIDDKAASGPPVEQASWESLHVGGCIGGQPISSHTQFLNVPVGIEKSATVSPSS